MKLFEQEILPDHFKQLETFLRGTGPDIWSQGSFGVATAPLTSEAEKPINTSERTICCWNLRELVNGSRVFRSAYLKTPAHTLSALRRC